MRMILRKQSRPQVWTLVPRKSDFYTSPGENEDLVVEITVEKNLKILAQAIHVIDSAGIMADPVNRQIGHV